MLQIVPENRPTISQILKSPWFSDMQLNTKTITKIKDFEISNNYLSNKKKEID